MTDNEHMDALRPAASEDSDTDTLERRINELREGEVYRELSSPTPPLLLLLLRFPAGDPGKLPEADPAAPTVGVDGLVPFLLSEV